MISMGDVLLSIILSLVLIEACQIRALHLNGPDQPVAEVRLIELTSRQQP